MNNPKSKNWRMLLLTAVLFFSAAQALPQDVKVRISDREAYVGSPLVLQIQIVDATNFELPDVFEIAGCGVRTAGPPSQSSQITIYNGRRIESRTITMQYLITPRREGNFEIPELTVLVDGKQKRTEVIPFAATKSVAGDLLFAEIIGDKQKVYVGQPLDLKLKIWIKPFRDRENRIKLNEGQMWQMLSEQTSWGKFSDRFQELAENRQRPGGKKVLRDDENGNEGEYFLYVIDATIYPTRPGKLDASDIQVVVDYPLEIGPSRDVFEDFFDQDGLSGSALIQRMMADDFGGSPFGRRRAISKSRPVVADAKVDSTEVLPVPMAGKPADYRGAVGRYRIVTQAESRTVDAGDPVTLRIGIAGNGPMELVQAPPLHEISALTDEFKITDQALGGFVQGDTKVFETTIRPRNADVKEIPPIPFSFFDPVSETYKTVYSRPIPLSVNPSEMLSLDSIVSNTGRQDGLSESATPIVPDFRNHVSTDTLQTESSTQTSWWFFSIVPALIWLVLLAGKLVGFVFSFTPNLRSPKSLALEKLKKPVAQVDISNAVIGYISKTMKKKVKSRVQRRGVGGEAQKQAVGDLRLAGLSLEANEVESLLSQLARCGSEVIGESSSVDSLQSLARSAETLIEKIDLAVAAERPLKLRSRRAKKSSSCSKQAVIGSLLLVGLFGSFAHGSTPQEAERLSKTQMQSIFSEANDAYQQAEEILSIDQAEAKELFATAADKYQLLVEQGIRNDQLFLNLGNSCLRSGRKGLAIANYYRALRIAPSNAQAAKNLEFAHQQIALQDSDSKSSIATETSIWVQAQNGSKWLVGTVGGSTFTVIFATASIAFWLLIILRTVRCNLPALRLGILPLLIMVTTGFCLFAASQPYQSIAILVVDQVELRSGDGEEFGVLETIEFAEGLASQVLNQRDGWLELSIKGRQSGWTPMSNVELID